MIRCTLSRAPIDGRDFVARSRDAAIPIWALAAHLVTIEAPIAWLDAC